MFLVPRPMLIRTVVLMNDSTPTIVFGILNMLLSLVAIFVAYLQLRIMLFRHHQDDTDPKELNQQKGCNFGVIYPERHLAASCAEVSLEGYQVTTLLSKLPRYPDRTR